MVEPQTVHDEATTLDPSCLSPADAPAPTPATPATPTAPPPLPPLSYRVYSLADLEARSGDVTLRRTRHSMIPLSEDLPPPHALVEIARAYIAQASWKKLGTQLGLLAGCVLVLLGVVLLVADLTDDVKPTHATRSSAPSTRVGDESEEDATPAVTPTAVDEVVERAAGRPPPMVAQRPAPRPSRTRHVRTAANDQAEIFVP
jgi:hypothetical protein